MRVCTFALIAAFALSGTAALAQGGAGSGATPDKGGMSKSDGTTGMKSGTSQPSAGSSTSDPSKSGAPTAAGPKAQGSQAEPGNVQKGVNPR